MQEDQKLIVFSVIGMLILVVGIVVAFRNQKANESMKIDPQTKPDVVGKSVKSYSSPPPQTLDSAKDYKALLKTSEGDIRINLFEKSVPITVNNFVFLAKEGFYNNTVFHRVIKDFMIQGGDPLGTGAGGPGYRFDDEPFSGEYERGILAMANAGPNTNGSQFFIMHKNYPLPKNYVIFGKVEDGLSVVDKIAATQVTSNSTGESSTPAKDITLFSVDILED